MSRKTVLISMSLFVVVWMILMAWVVTPTFARIGSNSCEGVNACDPNNGKIGNDSCNGNGACGNNEGRIGNDSCNSDGMGCVSQTGNIKNGSCNRVSACDFQQGKVSKQSCNAPQACMSQFGKIKKLSCNAPQACYSQEGKIAKESCNGFNACASQTGKIKKGSCNNDNACAGNSAKIGRNSCNGANSCINNDVNRGNNECNGEKECQGPQSFEHTFRGGVDAYQLTSFITGSVGVGPVNTLVLAALAYNAGPILGPASLYFNITGANQTAAEIQQLQEDMESAEQALATLQKEVAEEQVEFLRYVNVQDTDEYCTVFQNYVNALQDIFSTSANEFSTEGQITICATTNDGADAYGQLLATLNNKTLNAAAIDQKTMMALNTTSSELSSDFTNAISKITATDNLIPTDPVLAQLGQMVNPKVITAVHPANLNATPQATCGTSGALAETLQCGLIRLRNAIPSTQQSGQTNFTPQLENYNNLLIMYYQQSVAALQYAYMIEGTINYLNYQNYINSVTNSGTLQQISPIENINAISFNSDRISGLDTANAEAYYIAAQQNLTLIFAQRTNELYRNIMKFVVSDLPAFDTSSSMVLQSYQAPPFPSKSYTIKNVNGPTTVTVSYPDQQSMYTTVQASSLVAQTDPTSRYVPGADAFPIYNDSNNMPKYTENGFFYQYGGINNIYNCSSVLVGPSVEVSESCNSPFPQITQEQWQANPCTASLDMLCPSTFDGVNFNGYIFTGGAPALTPTLNLFYCNVQNSNYPHSTPTNSAPPSMALSQLQCGIWGGTTLANEDYVGENETNYSVNLAYGTPQGSNFCNILFRLGDRGTKFAFQYDPNNFNPIASSTTVAPYFGYYDDVFNGSGELQNATFINSLQSGYAELSDDGMSSDSAPHYLLMQVRLPNKVIAPFYVVTVQDPTYNSYGCDGAFAQAYCPQDIVETDGTTPFFSTPPSTQVSDCLEIEFGGFEIYTTDGSSYQVQLQSLSSGRGATITLVQ